jgi:ABC-type uncharacterized transport system substrate-binding protein
MTNPISEESKQGILEGLKESGWKEGENYKINIYNAQGDSVKLDSIMDRVKTEKYDLILVSSTPTLQAAIRKIKQTPVVFTTVADPVAAGAGRTLKDHLPNITGISTLGDYEGLMRILNRFIPKVKRIGTLFVPGEVNSLVNKSQLLRSAEKRNITVETIPINSKDEINISMNTLLKRNIQAICQVVGNLTDATFTTEVELALKSNIPVFGFTPKQAEQGAIAVMARDYIQAGKDAAAIAINILKGADPAEIPFSFLTKSNLIINKKTAKQYNVNISDVLLQQAFKVIE